MASTPTFEFHIRLNNSKREASVTPWDAGEFQPPLKEVIETNIDGIQWPNQTGKALVPGCGTVSRFKH